MSDYKNIPSQLIEEVRFKGSVSEFLWLKQNTMAKSELGRKGFIQITLPHWWSPLKEVRTGSNAEQEPGGTAAGRAMGGCCMLASDFLILLSHRTQGHQPREGTTIMSCASKGSSGSGVVTNIPDEPPDERSPKGDPHSSLRKSRSPDIWENNLDAISRVKVHY